MSGFLLNHLNPNAITVRRGNSLTERFYVAPSVICPQSFLGRLFNAFAEKGVFAKHRVKEGDIIGEFDGDECSLSEAWKNPELNFTRLLRVQNADGEVICRTGNNILKFINHSRTPNLRLEGFVLIAARDIEPGEELSYEYGDFDF